MKKIICILTSLIIFVTTVFDSSVIAFATVYTGECGENLIYSYSSSTGKLTISGTGDMYSFANNSAPWKNYSISSITIEDGVTSISNAAFYSTSASSVVISDSVIRIGSRAFESNYSLTNVSLSNNLETLSYGIFQYCTNLRDITLPNSLVEIAGCAFNQCYALHNINIPENVVNIDTTAFANCDYLCSFCVDERNEYFSSKSGVLFDFDKTTLYKFPSGISCSHYVIPKSVTTLAAYSFEKCNITSLYILKSLKKIDSFAFYRATVKNVIYEDTEEAFDNIDVSSTRNEGLINSNKLFNSVINHKNYSTEKEVIKDATCYENGYGIYKCQYGCEDELFIIPAGHNVVIDAAITPTCEKAGKTEGSHCSKCNKVLINSKSIAATGHNWSVTRIEPANIIANPNAYKIADGQITESCLNCKKLRHSEIANIKEIKLNKNSYIYDGKTKKPTVSVKDTLGKTVPSKYYTVTYASGRKNVGKYAVKITFNGNYSGVKTLYFTINPKATSISSVNAASKTFTVKWKKQATQTTGYQIQYATDSKFTKNAKTVTVSKNSTTSKKITKLTTKKKYFVRVRTYKTVKVNGKSTRIYSSWSKTTTVTTKK